MVFLKLLITQLNKLYHILGFHTLGKQHIKTKVFGINKTDKKYYQKSLHC